jgi:hypothetical protein
MHAPKHWAYWHPGNQEYITDPEIRDGTEKVFRVRFVRDCHYRKLIKPRNAAAIRRVLALVDGYLSTQNPDALLAWDGGMLTWDDLRHHVQAALKLTDSAVDGRAEHE